MLAFLGSIILWVQELYGPRRNVSSKGRHSTIQVYPAKSTLPSKIKVVRDVYSPF